MGRLAAGLARPQVGLVDELARYDQAEPLEILCVPAGVGDHGAEGAQGESIPQVVISHDYPSAIGMTKDAVAAPYSAKFKAVLLQCADEPSSCDPSVPVGHRRLTATVGVFRSVTPLASSTGMGSPDSRRSST